MPFVFSTATSPIDYVEYHPSPSGAASAKVKRKVRICGGANLAPLEGKLITPKGVATSVTDEELEFLLNNASFKKHMAAGYMSHDKNNLSIDKAVKDMSAQDGSAPITPRSKDVIGTAVPVVTETESSKSRKA